MTSQLATAWIELSRDDFVSAIKRLKPGRMLKAYSAKELQIGFLKGEAVFCIEGAYNTRQAHGCWTGFACLPFGMALPFLKVPPATDSVRIVFENEFLRIGTTRFKAKWVAASPWISEMALEAHFHTGPVIDPKKLYCPRCGKRQGVELASLQQKTTLMDSERQLVVRHQDTAATHTCGSCRHAWRELSSLDTLT